MPVVASDRVKVKVEPTPLPRLKVVKQLVADLGLLGGRLSSRGRTPRI
jgi:hypothetical protein